MIDEILQFHDKGDAIIEHLCKVIGPDVLAIDFQHYENTDVKIKCDFTIEILEFLSTQLEQEVDAIRKKCLVFILAKVIEETQIIPSIATNLLNDDSESPYILFRLAYVLYHAM